MCTLVRSDLMPCAQNSDKTLPLLFGKYAERYKTRPGGYTRIHKFGHRKGDHAPHAILELCDNPRDIKFEIVARSVGRETVQRWLKTGGKARADQPEASNSLMDKPWIREITKINYEQLMKFSTEERKTAFESRAIHWAVCHCITTVIIWARSHIHHLCVR